MYDLRLQIGGHSSYLLSQKKKKKTAGWRPENCFLISHSGSPVPWKTESPPSEYLMQSDPQAALPQVVLELVSPYSEYTENLVCPQCLTWLYSGGCYVSPCF